MQFPASVSASLRRPAPPELLQELGDRFGERCSGGTVEAGVTRKQLNAAIRDTGLFFSVDPGGPAEMAEVERHNQRIMHRALAMDGACTGEHGAGRHKVPLLAEEFGDSTVGRMRRLKAAWDPLNILNPGKVVLTG